MPVRRRPEPAGSHDAAYPAGVDFSEFDRLVEPLRARSARAEAEYGLTFVARHGLRPA